MSLHFLYTKLISKTLLLTLNKYLVDIDVQDLSIGLPDFLSSALSRKDDQNDDGNTRSHDGENMNYTNNSGAESTTNSEKWCLKLSNVKLREGVELMTLPKKKKRVVLRTKRKISSKIVNESKTNIVVEDSSFEETKKKSKESNRNRYDGTIAANAENIRNSVDTKHIGDETITEIRKATIAASLDNPSLSDIRNSHTHPNILEKSLDPETFEECNIIKDSEVSELISSTPPSVFRRFLRRFSSTEISGKPTTTLSSSSKLHDPITSESTPTFPSRDPKANDRDVNKIESKSDKLAVGNTSSRDNHHKNDNNLDQKQKNKSCINTFMSMETSDEIEEDDIGYSNEPRSRFHPRKFRRSMKIDKCGRGSGSTDDPYGKANNEENDPLCSSDKKKIGSFNQKEEQKKEFEKENLFQEKEEIVEEYVEEEMVLRTGKGGRVGTLHIKFVGKELHITVEDADLVVEVSRTKISSSKHSDDDAGDTEQVKKQNTSSTTIPLNSNSSQTQDKSTLPKTYKNDPPLTSTTSHNVDETEKNAQPVRGTKNPLAKLMSLIPNLLLTDCRIRIILRGVESESEKKWVDSNVEDNNNTQDCQTHPFISMVNTEFVDNPQCINRTDSVFSIGIGFLSVTSLGEDILAHVRTKVEKDEHYNNEEKNNSSENELRFINSCRKKPSVSPEKKRINYSSLQNEFIDKMLKTGKGHEGGIWLKILPPNSYSHPLHIADNAWIRFIESTQMCLLKCSGLNIHSRLFLGQTPDLLNESRLVEPLFADMDEEFTTDSLLYGVDYFGDSQMMCNEKGKEFGSGIHDSVNTVQNVHVSNCNFHRVVSGQRKRVCPCNHDPLDCCTYCWEDGPMCTYENRNTAYKNGLLKDTQKYENNFTIPLPGFVCNISVTGPFELNISRNIMDSLDVFKSFLLQDFGEIPEADPCQGKDIESFGNGDGKQVEQKKDNQFDFNNFPTFMRPDVINVIGLYLSNLTIRLHNMESAVSNNDEKPFSYWKLVAKSIMIDHQQSSAEILQIQDTKMKVGSFDVDEIRGTDTIHIVTIDLMNNCKNEKDETRGQFTSCTAADILNVPIPQEQSFQHNVIIFHLFSSPATATSMINCLTGNIGYCRIDVPWVMKDHMSITIRELMVVFFGTSNKLEERNIASTSSTSEDSDSSLEYSFRIDGGSVKLEPIMRMNFKPCTNVSGRKTSLGHLTEACTSCMKFEYGLRDVEIKSHLSDLSDSLRLSILLFLDKKSLQSLQEIVNVNRDSRNIALCQSLSRIIRMISSSDYNRNEDLGKIFASARNNNGNGCIEDNKTGCEIQLALGLERVKTSIDWESAYKELKVHHDNTRKTHEEKVIALDRKIVSLKKSITCLHENK